MAWVVLIFGACFLAFFIFKSSSDCLSWIFGIFFSDESEESIIGILLLNVGTSIALGIIYNSWWAFGGCLLIFIILSIIPYVNFFFCMLLWGHFGYLIGEAIGSAGAIVVISGIAAVFGAIVGLRMHFLFIDLYKDDSNEILVDSATKIKSSDTGKCHDNAEMACGSDELLKSRKKKKKTD